MERDHVRTKARPNLFIVQAKDDEQRRIIIDKEAWNEQGLQKGDYIEVTVRKIKNVLIIFYLKK